MEPKLRKGRSPALHLTLDAGAARPLYLQVYDGLRDAILAGRIGPGERLPSTRILASDLDVSRNTVLQAFEQLRSEGYLVGRRGGGTRVRVTLPESMLTSRPTARRMGRNASTVAAPGALHPSQRGASNEATPDALHSSGRGASSGAAPGKARVSNRGAQLSPQRSSNQPPTLPSRPFQLGLPALDVFPWRLWSRLAARRWRRGGVHFGHGDAAGEPELREAIASYVTNARGARCTADRVLVLNGAQQALHLIAHVILDAGDPMWVEDPGYDGARGAFLLAGARLIPVPVDADGLDVAAGERLGPGVRLAYVTPSHQYPLGHVMSAPRRLHLLAWARRTGAFIIEDDYDSEFRYSGRPLPCLQGLDEAQRKADEPSCVLYVGTLSKTLVPGLRLGYVIAPDELVDPLRAARAAMDRHTPSPEQGVLADFMGEGHYARHVRRVRNLCAERQAILLDAVDDRLGDDLHVNPDPAGLHVIGRLREGLHDAAVVSAAETHGVRVAALSRHWLDSSATADRSGLVLGYGAFDENAIRAGVEGLRRALRDLH